MHKDDSNCEVDTDLQPDAITNENHSGFDHDKYDPKDDILDEPEFSSFKAIDDLSEYPDPTPSLPELTDTQEAIVLEWLDNFPKGIESTDPDDAVARILRFMNEQPDLLLYLELESIFEIGNEFSRRKQWDRYNTFLKEIRSKRPDLYQLSFGWYDYTLICDAIATGQGETVSSYFDFYKKFKTNDPEHTSDLIRLLAWTNQEKALLEFIELTKSTAWRMSSGAAADDEADLYWAFFTEKAQYIGTDIAPDTIGEQIVAKIKEYSNLELPQSFALSISEEIQITRSPQTNWNLTSFKNNKELSDFFYALAWRFCAFLHHTKGIGWVKSRFLANRLLDYWIPMPKLKKVIKSLKLDETEIDKFLGRTYKSFFWIDGVRAGAFIEGLFYLAEFLEIHDQQAEMSSDNIRAVCKRLYGLTLRASDASNAIFRFPLTFLDTI